MQRTVPFTVLTVILALGIAACGKPFVRGELPVACKVKCTQAKVSLPKHATDSDYLRDLNSLAESERACRIRHNACVGALR